MENTSMLHEYYSVDNSLLNTRSKLFKVDSELNNENMNCIVLSPKPKDYEHAYIYHPNTNSSQNDNIYVESDEYDSDCSLGSFNSLYLRLKDNSKTLNLNETDRVNSKQSNSTICKWSKTDSSTRNNIVNKTNTVENIMTVDKTQDSKPITKLNTSLFYGQQKSTSQNRYTWRYTSFSHNSLKNPKQKRNFKTIQKTVSTKEIFHKHKNLNWSQLKKPIPSLQFTTKHVKKTVQNNQKHSWTNMAENLLPNKIEFMADYEHKKKEDNTSLEFSYVENQLYEQNIFYLNDFIDTDDFRDNKDIENIIQQLFDEDENIADIETTNWLKNEHDYEDHDKIENKFSILFKEFNNIKPYDN